MKRKRHEIVLVIRTDQECTKAQAIEAVRDSVHGIFYPFVEGVSEFKVKGVKGSTRA